MAAMEVSVADDLRQLIAKKDAIEKDLKEFATVLESVSTRKVVFLRKIRLEVM